MRRLSSAGGWPAIWYTVRKARQSGGVMNEDRLSEILVVDRADFRSDVETGMDRAREICALGDARLLLGRRQCRIARHPIPPGAGDNRL